MKQFLKFFSAALLFSVAAAVAEDCAVNCTYGEGYNDCKDCTYCGSTIILPRPQGSNTAALYNPYYYGCGSCPSDVCSSWTLGYRYNQTFHGDRLAKCLLGSDKLAFIGSAAPNQTPADGYQFVRADDFGLSPYYSGTICFNPSIKTNNIDFTARWELGNWYDCLEGLYFGVNATLTHTSWDWNCSCARTVAPNINSQTLPQGQYGAYVSYDAFTSIPEALEAARGFGEDLGVRGPATYGRFVLNDNAEATGLANVDAILGYDFLRCDCYHFGAFIRASAPTGNRPYSLTIFEPIVGNGHHWELGGGIDAHWELWNCDSQCITSYLTGNVTHLFKDCQARIVPLSTCCLSQYMLLKEFDADKNIIGTVRGTDLAARMVESSFGVQGDATLGFIYRNCGWSFGIGYNVFGRSAEKFEDIQTRCAMDKRTFGIKGLNGNYAPAAYDTATSAGWYLSSTNSTYCITNAANDANVDNSQNLTAAFPAEGYYGWITGDTLPLAPVYESANADFTANNPALLSTAVTRGNVGAPRMITNKVFGTIDYQWEDCDWKPYFGVGAEAEFGNHSKCEVCTPSQWGVWVRGGISF